MTMTEPFMDRSVRTSPLLGSDFDLFGNSRSSDDEAGGYFCLQLWCPEQCRPTRISRNPSRLIARKTHFGASRRCPKDQML